MRVLAPKVHVEVYRPTQIREPTEAGRFSSKRIDPLHLPTTLRYIRVVNIEDRRVKGIKFEETALFGGFIEINIAEDPQSGLFDKFLPNDHVEVFYNDTMKRSGDNEKHINYNLNLESDYDYTSELPKFQGASWKTDLIYKQSYVTTQLHAWDYLRILQYINIPRGERKERYLSIKIVPDPKEEVQLKHTQQRQKYGDDMLDYIDSALNTYVDFHGKGSIYGQEQLPLEKRERGGSVIKTIQFSPTSDDSQQIITKPMLTLYNAGIGEHCHNALRGQNSGIYSKFKEVYSNTRTSWSELGYAFLEDSDKIIKEVGKAIDDIGTYDMMQFRFLDGKFKRFKGIADDGTPLIEKTATYYVADIIAISQFALIELLVKKLTTDHGLNQWFTPIVRFDPNFLIEIQKMGKEIGKKVSKLIYVRFRTKNIANGRESTSFCFNIDTYPFAAKFSTEAFKLAIGNIVKTHEDESSESIVDKFAEIFTSVDFPQQIITNSTDDSYHIYSLSTTVANTNSKLKSQKQLFDDLRERFIRNFTVSQTFERDSNPEFYISLMKRVTSYANLIQKILSKDDKIISFIKGVPASFMRADIYTGSKFNTVQYDSLAITRIIQLVASSMAGFPATNHPKSNTEKGSIDSYPIFAANRIVIRPKTYFGIRRPLNQPNSLHSSIYIYDLYPSLTELFKEREYTDQGDAVCFLFLDVAKKKLKEEGEEPEFKFPLEDIQDFGMIKASTVNHYFNFSLADSWRDLPYLVKNVREKNPNPPEGGDPNNPENISDPDLSSYQNVTQNGIFIEYIEGNSSSVGFSPPEHQHLRLSDLTQDLEYRPWSQRFAPNTNLEYSDTSKPIFNPRIAYVIRQNNHKDSAGNSDPQPVLPNNMIVNNYNYWGRPFELTLNDHDLLVIANEDGSPSNDEINEDEFLPFMGTSGYIDISDLKAEYKTLQLILDSSDEDESTSYRDISNVDLELMENIVMRVPLEFKFNKDAALYADKIKFLTPRQIAIREGINLGSSLVTDPMSIKKVVTNINKELDKIGEVEMLWLFPYAGFITSHTGGNLIHVELDKGKIPNDTWRKHLFLITYLDLLIKGIRYVLWSMAKARFFAHVYLPIEYKKYARTPQDGINYASDVVEPGSSVQITYNTEESSLFKTIRNPLVAFPTVGLGKGDKAYLPLYRSISRGTELVEVKDERGRVIRKDVKEKDPKPRTMTWYVSKKVTYLGADTGAMMRVELTEGSLDWTLFYNEKNLLTQVSEHYMLNGLGNFRTGSIF